jgi:hypothetical protein
MGDINTSNFWATTEPVRRKYLAQGRKDILKVHQKVFKVGSADEPVRKVMEIGGPGQLMRKTEGANIASLTMRISSEKSVLLETFAGKISFSWEFARDNKVKEVARASKGLGRAVDLTKEYTAALVLDRAFNSSYGITHDGNELCATDHLIVGTNASTGANCGTTHAALSETALEDVYTALSTMVGSDGMLAPRIAKKLVVPAALMHTAKKLTKSGNTLGSANNDPKVVGDDLELVVNPYLSSATRWFVLTDSGDGLFLENDVDGEFMEDNDTSGNLDKVFVAISRFRTGCDEWRHVWGVNAS